MKIFCDTAEQEMIVT